MTLFSKWFQKSIGPRWLSINLQTINPLRGLVLHHSDWSWPVLICSLGMFLTLGEFKDLHGLRLADKSSKTKSIFSPNAWMASYYSGFIFEF